MPPLFYQWGNLLEEPVISPLLQASLGECWFQN